MRKSIASGVLVCTLAVCGMTFAGSDSRVYARDTDAGVHNDGDIEDIKTSVDSVDELEAAVAESDMAQADRVVELQTGEDEAVSGNAEENPYQLRRILLFADDVTDSYGAEEVICYDKYDYYMFGFATEADTEKAYRQMVSVYGSDKCMLDEIVYADDVLAGESEASSEQTAYQAVSWGNQYMGMDDLKSDITDYSIDAVVDVAVIDTGVNSSNPLFDGRIDVENSRNCYDADSPDDYSDTIGHGSHVAGIIADATPDNVKLTIIKCFASTGSTKKSVVQKSIMAAIDQGVDVINFSVCFYGTNASESTRAAIDPLIQDAREKNIVMCVAAGNQTGGGMDVAGNSYPADNPDVITVSALRRKSSTADADRISNDAVEFDSSYSYYGDSVDFAAPGTGITSAWKNGGTYTMTGTSMATPHITAAAAYVKMAEPGITAAETKRRLEAYSVDLGDAGKDRYYGYGCPYMASYLSDITSEPDEPKEPEDSNKADDTGKNDKTNTDDGDSQKKPDGSDNTEKPDNTENPDNTEKPDDTEKPDNTKKPGTPGTEKPEEVALTACAVTSVSNVSNGMKISWGTVKSAAGYNIYRKTATEGYRCIKTVSGGSRTTYTDTTAAPGVRYRYAVRAVRGEKKSGIAATVASVRLTQPKYTVKNAYLGIKITWNRTAGATGYKIYRKAPGSSVWIQYRVLPAGVYTYTDRRVADYKKYTYTVKAYRSYVPSSFDAKGVQVYRMPGVCIARIRSQAARSVDVEWKKAKSVSGYQIQYSTNTSFRPYKVATINRGSRLKRRITGLASGRYYYMRIRSYRITGGKTFYGGWSSVKRIKVR